MIEEHTKKNNMTWTNGITLIKDCAFKGCISLRHVHLGNQVQFIGSEVFEGCLSLTQIIIPNSVVKIGKDAFKNCPNLKYMILPDHLFTHDQSLTLFLGLSAKTSIYKYSNLRQLLARLKIHGNYSDKQNASIFEIVFLESPSEELFTNAFQFILLLDFIIVLKAREESALMISSEIESMKSKLIEIAHSNSPLRFLSVNKAFSSFKYASQPSAEKFGLFGNKKEDRIPTTTPLIKEEVEQDSNEINASIFKNSTNTLF
jgi:hypothetical protein